MSSAEHAQSSIVVGLTLGTMIAMIGAVAEIEKKRGRKMADEPRET